MDFIKDASEIVSETEGKLGRIVVGFRAVISIKLLSDLSSQLRSLNRLLLSVK